MKTGILFDDFTGSDKNYFLMKLMNQHTKTINEIVGFIHNVSKKVIGTDFAYTNMSDISHFSNGLLIATSLETADSLNKSFNSAKKILFLWNLEWFGSEFDYNRIQDILRQIPIVVRSEFQQKIIKNCFNIDSQVINLNSIEDFYEFC